MRAFGRGILSEESQIYLYESEPEQRRLFLYALCAGHYRCSSLYLVDRQNFDSYLLMYVHSGTLYVDAQGRHAQLTAPGFVLVDCYSPHIYGSRDGCELYWVHYDGNAAREFSEKIGIVSPILPRNMERCRRSLARLCDQSEPGGGLSDSAALHAVLTSLLMELLSSRSLSAVPRTDPIEEVRSYILDNPEKNLTIEELADRAHLSPYHFLRRFREKAGMTPHEYLLTARLNVARFYLAASDQSIKEIALSCGFSSDSLFCTSFKKHTGLSPSEYRRQQFYSP